MARQTAFQRASRRIETEGQKQCFLLYSAAALALQRHWGKKQEAIRRLFELSLHVWKDCARDHDSSMIQMCEAETGIEIQNGDGKSWRDVSYLNGCMNPGMMSEAQWLYMRQQQIKWVRPQVMACLMVAMHRKYGFGYERLSRIYAQMQGVFDEKELADYYVGTVEAEPSLDDVIAAIDGKGYSRVVLEPLMVVAGDHANNDMAGDEDDSWKTILTNEGYEVECILEGLGQKEGVQEIYAEHVQDAIDSIG